MMQVNLGNKIKELRKRDGRKQEDLASALGVTAQAVSRWESGGCYPDMNLIPSIANYFHISIDALFGYENDREAKIQEYLAKANRFFIDRDAGTADYTPIITVLRAGLSEFPGEPELKRFLAMALSVKGKQSPDRPSPYLEEAVKLYEELLADGHTDVIESLLYTYLTMGEYDKAEQAAKKQPSLIQSRELLLANLYEGDQGKCYSGSAILFLLNRLGFLLNKAVSQDDVLRSSKQGLAILETMIDLYDKVMEGDYGQFHSDLCMLELACAKIAATGNDLNGAKKHFASAGQHYESQAVIPGNKNASAAVDEHYQSALLSEADCNGIPIVICRPEYLKEFQEEIGL